MRRSLARCGPITLCVLTLAVHHRAEGSELRCTVEQAVGEVVSVQGAVDVLDTRGELLRRLVSGIFSSEEERRVCPGESLRTGPLARATFVVHEPPSIVRLDADTVLATNAMVDERRHSPIESPLGDDDPLGVLDSCRRALESVWLDLRRGTLRLFTTEPTRLDVKTRYLNASVEGTEFSLHVSDDEARVSVVEGVVEACNEFGSTSVLRGQTAWAVSGRAPAIDVGSEDAVRWALHYPNLDPGIDGTARTREALALMVAGRVPDALKILGDDTDAVDLALRAIVEMVVGERERARELARQAIEIDPRSPSAWTALSYVQQASFALEEALASATTAADLAPRDAVASARLAELELIAGHSTRAQEAAERGVRFGPELSRTHTVLGFIELDGRDPDAAVASFRRAIARDEADPLPRLGLALTEIRRGDTRAGLAYLETAISLDPESSLLRSYLGRVYALDGRVEQALDQFRLAEEIDQRDPLPHLHRAFVRHAMNDPHRALGDLQAALERNDNRGVFRTRSLLDADLATTLAARGRIYEEVGFGALTLREGTDALHRNPRDHAAHRLMADAYRARPRHEIAHASEQLQSQLRQPLNTNPVSPTLGLARLDDFPDIGPDAPSPNEYSRLFSRRGFTSTVTRTTGSNETRAEELQVNWLLPSTLASIGAYNFRTDGIDRGRDGRLRLASLFLQHRIDSRLSTQLEVSQLHGEGGADRPPRFDRDSFDMLDRFAEERRRARFGLSWRYLSRGDLLFSHDRGRLERRTTLRRSDTDSHHTELQLADRAGDAERVLGLSYSAQRMEESCDNGPFDTVGAERDFGTSAVEHGVAYGYLYPSHRYGENLRVDYTLGAGFDELDLRGVRERYLSPKLGVRAVLGRYRWRGALARTVTRTLATNRTLEPTQIAGFSQLYDDFAGTVSTLAGLGAGMSLGTGDSSWGRDVFLDAELVHRHLGKPTATGRRCPPGSPDSTTEFEERRLSIGLYTSFRLLSMALRFEREEYLSPEDERSKQFFVNTATDRLVVELHAGIGRHLRLTLEPQYLRQSGTFADPTRNPTRIYRGRDSFFTVDISLEAKLDGFASSRVGGSFGLVLANAFNESFQYQESDPNVPRVSYERTLSLRLQLDFD